MLFDRLSKIICQTPFLRYRTVHFSKCVVIVSYGLMCHHFCRVFLYRCNMCSVFSQTVCFKGRGVLIVLVMWLASCALRIYFILKSFIGKSLILMCSCILIPI